MSKLEYNYNNAEDKDILLNPELSVRIRTFGLVKIENSLGHFEEKRKTQPTSILLLKYLLVNHGRAIPQEELLELFWPNHPDPSNALRVWMTRLRASFTPMNLKGPRGLIISFSGYYSLNPNYIDQIDSVQIDQIAAQLSMADQASPEGLKLCAEALELYQGNLFGKHRRLSMAEKTPGTLLRNILLSVHYRSRSYEGTQRHFASSSSPQPCHRLYSH